VEIRPTEHADLAAQLGVFRAAIGSLYRPHSFEPPNPPDEAFLAQQSHLLEHDPERCFVAEEGGRVVGYGAAFLRDDSWFLASLFVLPEFQGRGIGPALLERIWTPRAARRLTLTDAIQPVSNTLYARRGLIPATPLLSLAGPAGIAAPQDLEPTRPDAAALARLDRAAYGFERPAEHELWARNAELTLWAHGGEPVAYSYSWAHGQIGPVAGLDGAAAAAALRAELARREHASVRAPGTAAALIQVAVEAGLRFSATPGLLRVSRGVRPPDALAISGYTLF
jgi:GNAT superfamily N-acetyltransferase